MKHIYIFAISSQVVLGCSQALLNDEVSCASVCHWTGPPPLSCSLVATLRGAEVLQDHDEVNGSFQRTEADEGNGNSSVSFQRGDVESEEENSCSVGLTALYEDRCSFEKDINRETSDVGDRGKKRESESQKSKFREKIFKKCCCTLTIAKAGKNTKLKSSFKTNQNIDRKGACWWLALSIQRKQLKSDFGILWKRISVFWESWFCETWGSMHLQVALEQTNTSSLSLPTRCPLKSCQPTTCSLWQGRMVPASTCHNVRSRRSPPDCCNSWHSPCNLSMAISSQQVAD